MAGSRGMSWFHARPVARDVWLVAEPVLMAHVGRGIADGRYLRDVADAFARLHAGDAVLRPARDCDEDPVREAVFDACSIYVAAEH